MDLKRISEDMARRDYVALCKAKPTPLSRRGLLALDRLFLQHRLETKTKKGVSYMDVMADSAKLAKLKDVAMKWRGKAEPLDVYYVFQLWYGTVNQFRPMFARQMYKVLEPKVGILDFSAGWGGRCLAAMSLGIPYHGIDSNTNLKEPYERLIDFVKPTAPVSMQFQPAETINFEALRGKYDLVFTSPPYFMLEKYQNMPAYKSKEEFITRFYHPVLMASVDNLLPGGRVALNIPFEMLEPTMAILGNPVGYYIMPKTNRNKGKEKMHEKVYLWIKA